MASRRRTQTVRETSEAFGRALDLLGRRWALPILWQLGAATLTFRELRTACGSPSPSVLQRRLHELRAAGIVEHVPGQGYRLTRLGAGIDPVLSRLDRWSRSGSPG